MSGLFNSIFGKTFQSEFFSPEVPPSGSGGAIGGGGAKNISPGKVGGIEETIDFLNEEEPPTDDVIDIKSPPKAPKKADEEEPEETPEDEESDEDELAEIEQELEGPPEEKLELVTPVRRQEILKKYPQLFKDFPQLENSYYRDQQFTEMFGTVKDAKQVQEKAEILDRFEGDIMKGDITTILKAVREENPNSFLKIADDYMNTLATVDQAAYMHVLGDISKRTIIAMVKESRRSGNEALQSAAQILNQFVFGSSDFVPPSKLSKENPNPEQDEQQNERETTFMRNQFNSTREDLDTRVNNTLRNTIDAHIDPRKTMSDYVRKQASRDAMELLAGLISKDTKFKSLNDKLWEKVFETNFSRESIDRVRSAHLSKARTLLPSVIKKARNEALRGTGHRVREDEEEEVSTGRKGPISPGKPRSQSSGKIKEGKDIPRGMSTLDFLNSE